MAAGAPLVRPAHLPISPEVKRRQTTSFFARVQFHHIGMSLAGPASGLSPTPDHLPDDVDTLKQMVLELLASLHEHRRDNEALRHRLDLLLRRLYGPRGERFNPNQPLLFAELAEGQDTDTTAPLEPDAPSKFQRRC